MSDFVELFCRTHNHMYDEVNGCPYCQIAELTKKLDDNLNKDCESIFDLTKQLEECNYRIEAMTAYSNGNIRFQEWMDAQSKLKNQINELLSERALIGGDYNVDSVNRRIIRLEEQLATVTSERDKWKANANEMDDRNCDLYADYTELRALYNKADTIISSQKDEIEKLRSLTALKIED